MFAAIPYFQLSVTNLSLPGLGEIPLDPWAALVCLGFVVGMEFARSRGLRLGIEPRDIVDGAVFIVGLGFVVGHFVTVLAYYPERISEQGIWALLKLWEGFSSFGGFLGAVIGTFLFYKVVRPRKPFWRYADMMAFGLPFGWFFGRVGCGVVHDHVGRQTDFFLAMDFDHGWFASGDPAPWAQGIRHELGLYEAGYMLLVSALFWYLGQKDRAPGFFVGVFAILYAPVRFGLDSLRNTDLYYQDVRYYGLTPAQYGAVIMLGLGVALLATRDWSGEELLRLDGSGQRLSDPPSDPKEEEVS